MDDRNPLIRSTVSDCPSTVICDSGNGESDNTLARSWSCSRCGSVLGIIHVSVGVLISLFDMLTRPLSDSSYTVSAAILYIICSILCFIATRRVDRFTQILLIFFAAAALVMSSAIFLENAMILNESCYAERYDQQKLTVHAILVVVSLSESGLTLLRTGAYEFGALVLNTAHQVCPYCTAINESEACHRFVYQSAGCAFYMRRISKLLTCFITIVVCFRSVKGAVAVSRANSPYSTLIIGDYSKLQGRARIIRPKFQRTLQR